MRHTSFLRGLALCGAAVPVITACTSDHTVTTLSNANFVSKPCSVSSTLTVTPAQSARVDCSNGGNTLTLAGNGASYLIVPQFATDQAADSLVTYTMSSGTLSSAASTVPRIGHGAGLSASVARITTGELKRARPLAAQHRLDAKLRARGRAMAPQATRAARARPGTVSLDVAAGPTIGSLRAFHVNSSALDATTQTFITVTAKLQYAGSNVLVYVDTANTGNGFTAPQMQAYGQYFDTTLDSIAVAAFGAPTDIDGNGHVIMLLTPVVNAIVSSSVCATNGYIAGFFDPTDFDGASNANSNQGEIFYSVAPDPSGTYSCAHTVADLGDVVPATFLHELQHLIDYGQHVVVHGVAPLASWLDEGLSITAEELGSVYYEQKCPPPACRADPSQLFPDSSQAFVSDFLYDSYVYAFLPDTASVTLHDDSDDGSAWRGGDWLLVRWLADHYGNTVLKTLAQSSVGGVSAIESATGGAFPQLFSDFSLSLYTDSLPGLPRTTAAQQNRFTSRNLRQLWSRLYATSGGSGGITLPMPVQLFQVTADSSVAVMVPGTATYFRLDTPASQSTVTVRFAAPGGQSFAPALHSQIAVFRLPTGQ